MHKPQIIFFDIDGTLIDMEKKQVTPLMLDTLHRLQANGIRLAIATGRSPMTVPLWDFPGVRSDVLVTFNGAYCYDKNRVLFAVDSEIVVLYIFQVLCETFVVFRSMSLVNFVSGGVNGVEGVHSNAALETGPGFLSD